MLVVHILAGSIALLGGFAALFSPKGGRVHRAAGTAFAWAMLAMTASGAGMALFDDGSGSRISVIAGVLSFQLVATGWFTVRPPARFAHGASVALASVAGAAAIAAATMAAFAAAAGGRHDGMPLPVYVLFGTLAALSAVGDARVLGGRRLDGRLRLARHLWRMGAAMSIATMSFFFGQADEFPAWLRHGVVSGGPPLAVVATVLGYFVKTRFFRAPEPRRPTRVAPAAAEGV